MASSTPLSKANTSFSLALFRELGDNDRTANIFYSPFSISSALAMVLLGAGGNTAAEMSKVGRSAHRQPSAQLVRPADGVSLDCCHASGQTWLSCR